MTASQVVGAQVRARRKAMGMSQQGLAEACSSRGFHAHQTTIAKLERGARPTTVDDLVVLADVFGALAADFLMEETLVSFSPDDERVKNTLLAAENAHLRGLLAGIAQTAKAAAS